MMQVNVKTFLQEVLTQEKYLERLKQYDDECEAYSAYTWSSQVRSEFSQAELIRVFVAANVLEASKDHQLRRAIDTSNLGLSFLTSELEKESPNLWEAASREFEALDEAQQRYVVANASFERKPSIRVLSAAENVAFELGYIWLDEPIIFLGIPGLFAGAYFLAALLAGWTTPVDWVLNLLHLPWDVSSSLVAVGVVAAIAVALAVGLFLSVFVFEAIDDRLTYAIDRRHSRSIPVAEENIEEARQAAEQAVIENGLRPEIELIVEEYSKPSYSTELRTDAAPTLAEVFNPKYEIPTRAKSDLARLISHMPGGSIGIAGPRGIGKTTLLRTVSDAKTLKNRPVLSVVTSAPVEYETRDFVLHIFSSVCKRFLYLKDEATEAAQDPWTSMRRLQEPFRQGPVASLFFDLLGGKRALGFLLVGVLLIWFSLHLIDVVSATNVEGTVPEKTGLLERYAKGLGIQPSFVFYWGVLLMM